MAALEHRSVSNLIEVMADEHRKRLKSIGGGVDVEKLNPDLIIRDRQGKPQTVRYE